jgi:hypothetical protein
MRAFVRAHHWFFGNRAEATRIAVEQSGIPESYALRAWDEYSREEIFPKDGDLATAAVQTLIEISSLIRAIPNRRKTSAEDYIDRSYLRDAQRDLAQQAAIAT